jgi:hypothetical protein
VTSKRTDIEIIGHASVAPDAVPLPSIKRIRINGTEVATNGISIEGATANGKYEQLLAVNVTLLPSSLRFVGPDDEPAPAVDGAVVEALAMANERVKELERQLAIHHHHDTVIEEQLEVIARAIAPIGEATDDPIMPIGQRVRLAIDTLAHRAHALQGELNGMHHRERQVDKVVDAWDNGSLKGYDGTIDPETPAGRVVELLREVCKARSTSVLEPRGAALNAILANLRTYGLDLVDDDYPTGVVKAVSVALRDRGDALQQLRTIDNALTMHADKRDPMTMALKHPADTAARVAEALSTAGRVLADINRAADTAEQAAAVTEADGECDAIAADMFIKGMRAAAHIAAGDTPEADPNVAHIDTVNGRGAHAQRADDRPVGAQVRHPDPLTDPEENG